MDRRTLLAALLGLSACAGSSLRSETASRDTTSSLRSETASRDTTLSLRSEATTQDAAVANVSFEVQVLSASGPSAILLGAAVPSGQRLALVAESAQPAFLYVGHHLSGQAPALLYPASGQPPSQATPARAERLPKPGSWFQLDAKPGEETLYLIASTNQLPAEAVLQLLTERVATDGVRGREPPPVLTEKNRGTKAYGVLGADGVAVVAFPIVHR